MESRIEKTLVGERQRVRGVGRSSEPSDTADGGIESEGVGDCFCRFKSTYRGQDVSNVQLYVESTNCIKC